MELPRKSLRGYEVRAVQETYEELQFLHERRMTGLQEELLLLREANKRLEAEAGQLAAQYAKTGPIAAVMTAEEASAAGSLLLQAHEEHTRRIGSLLAAVAALQAEQREELAAKQAQRAEVLTRIQERLAHAFAPFRPKEE